MSEYTPTTEGIALVYVNAHPYTPTRAAERFDRWLAAHDAAIRADEREKAAQRVAAIRRDLRGYVEVHEAIAAARGDGAP